MLSKLKACVRVIASLLVTFTATHAADIRYEEESMEGPFSYFSQPCMALGVKDHTDAFAVYEDTWDKTLFFTGERPRILQKRVKTLHRGYLPIIECTETRDGIRYDVQAFGDTLSGKPEGELVLFARISATNLTDKPRRATVWASSINTGRLNFHGYLRNMFTPDRSYRMEDGVAVVKGPTLNQTNGMTPAETVLYLYDEGAVTAKYAAVDVPYRGPFTADDVCGIPMTPTCAVRFDFPLKPGETRGGVIKAPRRRVEPDSEICKQIGNAKYDEHFKRTVDFWEGLLADAARFHIPHKKAHDKLRTAFVYLLIARVKQGDRYLQYVDRLFYPRTYFRDGIFIQRAYQLFGHPRLTRENMTYYQGTRFGTNSITVAADPEGALHPPVDDRLDLNKYQQKLWSYSEHFLFTDDRRYAEEVMPEVKGLVGWIEQVTADDPRGLIPRCTLWDAEFVRNGYRPGDDFWAMAALRATRLMGQRLGDRKMVERIDRILARFHPALVAAIDEAFKQCGHVPGTLDKGTSPYNDGWGEDRDNQLMIWPSGALEPFHPAVNAMLERLRSRFDEGVSGNYCGFPGKMFPYRTFWQIQQHLARGEQELVTKDLYAILAHTGSTNGSCEIARTSRWGIESHGWHWARYVSLVRNMLVREEWDGTLHLLSTVPAEWASQSGNKIGAEKLPTHFGPISVVATIFDDGAEIDLSARFHHTPSSLVLHMPYFADVAKVEVDGQAAPIEGATVRMPADTKKVRLYWKTKPDKMSLSYADFLRDFRKTIPPVRVPIRCVPSHEERRAYWNTHVMQPWKAIGPFPDVDRTGHKTAYPPEKEIDFKAQYEGLNGKRVGWRSRVWATFDTMPVWVVREIDNRRSYQLTEPYGSVDFSAVFGMISAGTGYAYSNIISPKEQKVTFSLGSDAEIVVWLRGEEIHHSDTLRGWSGMPIDADKVEATLKKGPNPILVKTCRMGIPWGFAVRILDPNGKAVEGLRFDPERL